MSSTEIHLKKAFGVLILLVLLTAGGRPALSQNGGKETKAKAVFVAYNWMYKLGSPTYPVQTFVVELSRKDRRSSDLAKLLYFPKPSSTHDEIRFLDIQPLLASQDTEITMRRPDREKGEQCGHYANFVDDGTKGGKPQLVFRSFQYDAFMTFEFDKMECYELIAVQPEQKTTESLGSARANGGS